MELEAVRALKREVVERVVAPLLLEARSLGTRRVAAMALDRVTGAERAVALGVTRGRRARDYRLAVRIQRRTLHAEPALAGRIEELARGEADIRYVGRIGKRGHPSPALQGRQRPVLVGASIGHVDVTAGTLGAFVRRRGNPLPLILSNNHVLANEDAAMVGDAILQPGKIDGGRSSRDQVGTVLDAVPLRVRGNAMDAALGQLAEGIAVDPVSLGGLGRLRGLRAAPLEPGDRVMKRGRTTGETRGTVTAIELDGVVVSFGRGDLSFDGQVEIEGRDGQPFSAGGDSGSLILDEAGDAAALLFAGSDQGGRGGLGLTYANELGGVLRRLRCTLETGA